ncbi:fumarylacetoacetate hydrolase family protein [Caenimonas soli]|uniref:fumarylacetoacetate hydrolase family protein n=1 Tax=Caenimonas soli TaxID=2735555 RepID=UPI0015581BBE|nr:fumarylacetoacetate hydrolase family protein [Caenimonas soli]NPC55907.1 fumarylacetoacetate hydrolase family protein [Caenimonas soli]
MSYRLLSFRGDTGEPVAGLLVQQAVYTVAVLPGLAGYRSVADLLNDWTRAQRKLSDAAMSIAASGTPGMALDQVQLLPPVPSPGAVFCSGGNYTDHVEEMRALSKLPAELTIADVCGDSPWHFVKTSRGSVVGPGSSVANPGDSKMLDWELELVAVIGKPARAVPVDRALEHVAGYMIANDLSARDRAVRPEIHQSVPFRWDWMAHKCFDGSFPCGPWITPAEDIPNPQQLAMKLWVNDQLMQDSNTSRMIFSVAQQIAHLSRQLTLNPGDLISTGTPAGVGSGRGRFLARGDALRLEIERIGELRHTIAE